MATENAGYLDFLRSLGDGRVSTTAALAAYMQRTPLAKGTAEVAFGKMVQDAILAGDVDRAPVAKPTDPIQEIWATPKGKAKTRGAT